MERNARRKFEGVVVSAKRDKTVTVQIERKMRHPRYEKLVKKWSKYHAHDEANIAKEGDFVRIVETRPLSKTKKWRVEEIIAKAK